MPVKPFATPSNSTTPTPICCGIGASFKRSSPMASRSVRYFQVLLFNIFTFSIFFLRFQIFALITFVMSVVHEKYLTSSNRPVRRNKKKSAADDSTQSNNYAPNEKERIHIITSLINRLKTEVNTIDAAIGRFHPLFLPWFHPVQSSSFFNFPLNNFRIMESAKITENFDRNVGIAVAQSKGGNVGRQYDQQKSWNYRWWNTKHFER